MNPTNDNEGVSGKGNPSMQHQSIVNVDVVSTSGNTSTNKRNINVNSYASVLSTFKRDERDQVIVLPAKEDVPKNNYILGVL